MKTCPTCAATYANDVAFCPRDGAGLRSTAGLEPGAVIRRKYKIINEIGRGGMGVVYRARHLAWNEDKALKVLTAEGAGAHQGLKGLMAEALVMRQLQHPNIVRVEDTDYTDDDQPFVVMEYVPGDSARERLQTTGPLPPEFALRIAADVCSALSAAHEKGIIHRDIKPQNLLLAKSADGHETVKVIDFGIAKVREDAGLGFTGVLNNTSGMFVCTPAYASPEQAQGMRGGDLDGRSDLYSLGIVLYEMLTGRQPFAAATPEALLWQRLQVPPPPLGQARPDLTFAPDISGIVMKALERDRENRYGSAEEMRRAILAFLDSWRAERERQEREKAERAKLAAVRAERERLAQQAAALKAEEERLAAHLESRGAEEEKRERERVQVNNGTTRIKSNGARSRVVVYGLAALAVLAVLAFFLAQLNVKTPAQRPSVPATSAPVIPPPPPGFEIPAQRPSVAATSAPAPGSGAPTHREPPSETRAASASVPPPVEPPPIEQKQKKMLGITAIKTAKETDPVPSPAVAQKPNEPQQRTRTNPTDGLVYVWVPPGTFTKGCSTGDSGCDTDEKPAHQVTISKGFWMGQTPVTQAAYQRVIGKLPSYFHGANLPVETVSWNDAQSYCAKVDMRLPTEAEWEYAARAGSKGSRYGDIAQIAWYNGNSHSTTHDVGQKQANAWRLYDTLGNVWQWTADWYGSYRADKQVDPTGPSKGQYRTLRGGSWYSGPRYVRASFRNRGGPEYRSNVFGFRCVGN